MTNSDNIELKALQEQEFEILCVLDDICRKHGLTYFLTAGTLLGAVRHKGFIPWDDDIDAVMPLKDYGRLAAICRRELSDRYFYQDTKSERNYPFRFAKIRKNGTFADVGLLDGIEMNQGYYIDIFPLEKCPENDKFGAFIFTVTGAATYAMLKKSGSRDEFDFLSGSARRLYSLLVRLPRGFSLGLRAFVCFVYRVFCSGKRLCTAGGGHGYPCETYRAEWFASSVPVTFEGREFPAPIGYHELLTNMYGDYMTPPPENERKGH